MRIRELLLLSALLLATIPKSHAEPKPKSNQVRADIPSNGLDEVQDKGQGPPKVKVSDAVKVQGQADLGSPAVETTTEVWNSTDADIENEEFLSRGPAMFTVTSSDVGRIWEKLPFRERYLWRSQRAPCHSFKLQVPDERKQFSTISLCIFRPYLEYPDETSNFIKAIDEEPMDGVAETKQLRVFGYVEGRVGSSVFGRIVGTAFYGEISIYDEAQKSDVIYVVEEIKLLKRLMRYNEKILMNILSVMSKGSKTQYNAVVTQGSSLLNFMASVNPSEFVKGSFLVFTTNRNSYIIAGEPQMEVDEEGKITFNAGGDKIEIENAGHPSINLVTGPDRVYIFRPNGKTVLQDGTKVDVLEENEGAVAVSAFTAESSYGCVLPTPAFRKQRAGGYLCKVCLVADKSFMDKYMAIANPQLRLVSLLGRVIDNVSWIFRSTDWNGDGAPDNVGLGYDRQHDTFSYLDNGDEELDKDELDALYGNLARMDFADCCLAVAYTMKRFPGPTFGKLAAGNEKKLSAHNGVCGGKDQSGLSNNVLLISANSKQGNYSMMTESQLTILTAQQIGRAFGAVLDGAGDESCDTFKDANQTERHFLMWPDAMRSVVAEEKVMSKCSKLGVTKTLSQCKSACFNLDKHPFCGNGIIEDGEECDCGSEHECAKQRCCYSRVGLHPCRKTGIDCKKNSAPNKLVSALTLFFSIFFAMIV